MSRSGYSYDLESWAIIRWRGQVASAIRGKRGQRFLTDLLAALDNLPVKRLIRHELQDENGEVCAIGALGKARGVDMKRLDPDEPEDVAEAFDVARQLACEVVHVNDEWWGIRSETPEQRFTRLRKWVAEQIRTANVPDAANEPTPEVK